jgi:hypothetical protein
VAMVVGVMTVVVVAVGVIWGMSLMRVAITVELWAMAVTKRVRTMGVGMGPRRAMGVNRYTLAMANRDDLETARMRGSTHDQKACLFDLRKAPSDTLVNARSHDDEFLQHWESLLVGDGRCEVDPTFLKIDFKVNIPRWALEWLSVWPCLEGKAGCDCDGVEVFGGDAVEEIL